MEQVTRRVLGLVCCVALLSSMAAMPAAAQSNGGTFLVELDAEGDADVSVAYTYDLENDDEADAFETISQNETVRAAFADRFESRMSAVAERSAERTGREMSVTNAAVELERADGVGLVTLSVHWSGLAAVDDGAITATEPFASGFSPARPLTVSAPDGYAVTATTPTASDSDGKAATWGAGTDPDGFEVTAERTETEPAGDDADGTEDTLGFGIAVTVVALVAAALARRR